MRVARATKAAMGFGFVAAAIDFVFFLLLMLITRGPLRLSDFRWLFGDVTVGDLYFAPFAYLVFTITEALAAAFARERPGLSLILFGLVLGLRLPPALASAEPAPEWAILVWAAFWIAPVALLGWVVFSRPERAAR